MIIMLLYFVDFYEEVDLVTATLGESGDADGRCGGSSHITFPDTIATARPSDLWSSDFPTDFSIVAVIKPANNGDKYTVFTLYSDAGDEQLALSVGYEVTLLYASENSNQPLILNYNVSINEQR